MFSPLNKIRTKITLALILAGLIPVALLIAFSLADTSNRIRQDKLACRETICREIGSQVERVLENTVNFLGVLSTNPVLIGKGVEEQDRFHELIRARDALSAEITLLDANGFIMNSSSKSNASLRETSAWFQYARDRRVPCVSSPTKPPYSDQLLISAYLPVAAEPDSEVSVIKATLPFDQINEILSHVDLGGGGKIILLDPRNNLLVTEDPELLLEKYEEQIPPAYWAKNPLGIFETSDGKERLYVATNIEVPYQLANTGGWNLLWVEDPRSVMAVIRKTYLHHAAAALIGLFFALAIGLIVGRQFAKPVVATSMAAQGAADGDFGVRLQEYGTDEIGDLGRAFNAMMEKLEVSNDQVRKSLAERTESLLLAESTMAQLRSTYEAVDDGLLVVGKDGEIVQMNSAFCRIFELPSDNYSEMKMSKLYDWLLKCAADKGSFDERWSRYQAHPERRGAEEMVLSFPSDKFLEVFTAPVRNTVSPEPFARLWIFRDETEFRGLEDQLRQSQKMEAVGQLAGGIAHDFNNLLTGISGNLALALCKIEGNDFRGATPHLQTAQGASERSAALVKQLLGYSRKSTLDLKVCNVNDIVIETEGILAHTLDKKIKLSLGLEEDLWDVEIDPNQMQQVLMNLCVNGRDSIEGGGTITVGTQAKRVRKGDTLRTSIKGEQEVGDYVVISVADTGCGMTKEQQARMYEPFYTTKEQGKGTGLGLAMCYGIVKQHGGWITCRSNMGVGTCFRIFLPRAQRIATIEEEDTCGILPINDPSQFTILLADDEPAVRMVAESLLRREGFVVHTVANGLEAVRISRELGDDLDLAILDLTMPKLSGGEAFAIMSEEFPARPVLICSGYMLDLDVFRVETGHAPAGFIQKPYKLDTMVEEIARVLNPRKRELKGDVSLPS